MGLRRRDGDGGGALGLLDGAAQLLGAVLAERARARVLDRPRLVARRRSRLHGPPAAARLRGELGGLGWGRPAGSLAEGGAALLRAPRMPANELHNAVSEGRLADLAAELTAKDAEGTLAAGAPCRAPHPTPPALSHPRPGLCMAAALAERDGSWGGCTPLHRAAMCRQPEGAAAGGVQLLVAAGAD
eukprot:COSAG04_NODE_2502_length_4005_cov_2.639017_1_plen_186_part_10